MTPPEAKNSAGVTQLLDHIKRLMFESQPPPLPPQFAGDPRVAEIHTYLVELRKYLGEYAQGNFCRDICLRGVLAGRLKALQANMMHLIWQMKRVEEGDFTQRVEFMGEFSENFNNMVVKLDEALTALRQKEDELQRLTMELETEVEKRGAALAQVRASEEKFKYLAEHDPLTGLLNRRSFADQAAMNLTRASLTNSPCCVALMDVDHFKRFNDTYGHPTGDLALKHIAQVSLATLRSDDIMARYGGEEFEFFFAKASAENGHCAAERIRLAIESSPLAVGGKDLPLTVSIGVAALPPEIIGSAGECIDSALKLADEALYAAKHGGRNTVRLRELPGASRPASVRSRRHTSVRTRAFASPPPATPAAAAVDAGNAIQNES